MPKKTVPTSRKPSAPTGQTSKAKPKVQITQPSVKSKRDASMPQKALRASRAGSTALAAGGQARPAAQPAGRQTLPAESLAKAEANIAAAIESLNTQMNAAMATMTELAVAQRGRGEDYLRTAPLDRATATFQRLVGEVLDDHLVEMLPTLIALQGEMAEKARTPNQRSDDDFYRRGTEMLDQVLSTAQVKQYDARPGEAFDPLIHLAVGETHRGDMTDGVVAEFLQPGFRTARGKIVAPAKVKVNRR
ncbi:MAG TPA: nucleotide exchange factor GrpE [Phycisphaerae bacterium]|nr:nucleotide exchange factor GrpE [Phycisphaerae bacterium]